MIRCEDWGRSAADEIEPLLALEREAWLSDLDWDVTSAWHAVEPARRAGTLPGFVARDEGDRIVGWTSFLLHRDTIQVLAFVAPAARTAAALVDALLDADETASADTVLFCVRAAAESLPDVLAARGFRVEPYRYLAADLSARGSAGAEDVRPWAGDGERFARLLARAYEAETTTRAFAPHGTSEEWTEYVITLLTTTGCGRFVAALSRVALSARCELAGAVVVTELAPGTSHVAQIAVDPVERGRGLGRHLLDGAMWAAAGAGYARMTLLVAGSNRTALALYKRAGFRDRSRFTVAMAGRSAFVTAPSHDDAGHISRQP